MSITSSDIARMAGVSRSAVSAVLNGHYNKVSLEKREKILSIAHDLRYRPNQAALVLAKKPLHRVGILTSPFMSGIYSDLIGKLVFSLKEQHYSASVLLPVNSVDEQEILSGQESSGVDGLLIAYALNDVRKFNLKIPFVSLSPYPGQYEVRVDLRHGAKVAAEHLLQHGHHKVGMLCPKLSVVPLQHKGYMDAVGKNTAILEATENKDFTAASRHFIDKEKVRAWIVTNDLLAARFMKFLIGLGYRIPEDVAMIGFDGAPLTEVTPAKLTTLVFPAAEIARQSIDLLLKKIEAHDLSFHKNPVLIPPVIHIGESCGCPASPEHSLQWIGQRISLDGPEEILR